jgi:hypothetical protein
VRRDNQITNLPDEMRGLSKLEALHRESRAEPLFLQLCCALDTEEEYTRDMATEALGNTSWRPRSQRALAERLFDPSPSVRYAALCACPAVLPEFLRRAIVAKLEDPDRVDDNRVIATLAAEILDRKRSSR